MRNLTHLFSQSKFTEIVSYYESGSFDPGPLSIVDLQTIAASYYKLSRYQDSADAAVYLFPFLQSTAEYYATYAASLRQLGDLQKAQEIFLAGLKLFSDHPVLLNNYSNLLVDIGQLDKASSLLQAAIKANPEYTDAINNLSRVEQLLASKRELVNTLPDDLPSPTDTEICIDPLLLAFTDQEVSRFIPPSSSLNTPQGKLDATLSEIATYAVNDSISETSQELLSIASQLATSNPALSLEYCNKLHEKLGPNPFLFATAGDAYLTLKCFADAELSYLYALLLSSQDSKVIVNLISLTLMRGNFSLSMYFIQMLKKQHPDHVKLKSVLLQYNQHISNYKPIYFQPSTKPDVQGTFIVSGEESS